MEFIFTANEYEYVFNRCQQFAKKEYKTTKHVRANRKQFNQERIIHQTTIGKIGEFAVMFALLEKGHAINSPDMEITMNKSFDADLCWNNRPLHVKSQSRKSAEKFGTSWTFQKGGYGNGHTDPLTKKVLDEDVVFCVVDEKKVIIYGPYPWMKVKPLLRDPVLERLKKIKQCVYLEDLKSETTIS